MPTYTPHEHDTGVASMLASKWRRSEGWREREARAGLDHRKGARAYWQTVNGTLLSLSGAFETGTSLVFKVRLRVKLSAVRTRRDHVHFCARRRSPRRAQQSCMRVLSNTLSRARPHRRDARRVACAGVYLLSSFSLLAFNVQSPCALDLCHSRDNASTSPNPTPLTTQIPPSPFHNAEATRANIYTIDRKDRSGYSRSALIVTSGYRHGVLRLPARQLVPSRRCAPTSTLASQAGESPHHVIRRWCRSTSESSAQRGVLERWR
ncbi:hypothetical protein PENSPDRAFT_238071 [Peniophora sp. CONT]|nr:hypothetical protein PENSPDRAFT_238071 [Peniophora sp. CONT]